VVVYDAAGRLAAEYGGPANPLSGTTYLTGDHLGSTRMVTNAAGTVVSRYDYAPFGEELTTGIDGRTAPYSTNQYPTATLDGTSQKFTSKERDAESGLDFFESRYYSSAQGRFTSPDEFKGGIVDAFTRKDIETNTALPYADITDPQTLNKYAYVRNNPLRYIDPTGHEIVGTGPNGEVVMPNLDREIEVVGKFVEAHPKITEFLLNVGLAVLTRGEGEVPGGVPEAPTMRSAQRMGMREEGIPTSQQPVSQQSIKTSDGTAVGRQYTYEVPKPGGGAEPKIVQRNLGTTGVILGKCTSKLEVPNLEDKGTPLGGHDCRAIKSKST